MKSKLDLIHTTEYWVDELQNEIFRQVTNYMNSNELNQKQLAETLGFSKGYVSQILNGDCNFTIKKIVELSIKLGKAPVLRYVPIEAFYEFEKFKISFYNNSVNNFKYKILSENSTLVTDDSKLKTVDLTNLVSKPNFKDYTSISAA